MNFHEDRAEAVANFIKLGLALGIETATFRGELGVFEGYLNDDVIFKYSLLDGYPWSYALQDFLLTKIFRDSTGAYGGTYVDVGANIGLIVIPIAEKGGIQCYAFEPEPNNYALLCRNVVAHQVESLIKTFPLALFSEKTSLPFELCARNYGDHRIRPNQPAQVQQVYEEQNRQLIRVNAEKLDDLLDAGALPKAQQLKKPVVLKVDVQGAEVHFARGASRFLQAVDYLVIECWPYGLAYFGDQLDVFLAIIEQFPFAAAVDFVDRVRSVHFELKPTEQIVQQIRAAVQPYKRSDSCLNPAQLDPDQEINIVCSRQPYFPADRPATLGAS